MDVKSAFLNGILEKEVFIKQPPEYIKKGQDKQVYKLNKALYGLKQAPCAWHTRIDTYLLQHGFQKSHLSTHFTLSQILMVMKLLYASMWMIQSLQEIVNKCLKILRR